MELFFVEATSGEGYAVNHVKGHGATKKTPRRSIQDKSRIPAVEDGEPPKKRFGTDQRAGLQFDFAKAWGDAGIALESGNRITGTKTSTRRTGERSRGLSGRTSPSRESSRSYGSEREGGRRHAREASLSAVSDSRVSDSLYTSYSTTPSRSTTLQPPKEVGPWQPSSSPKRSSPKRFAPILGRTMTLRAPTLNRGAAPFRPRAHQAGRVRGAPGLHARANTDMGPIQGHDYGKGGPMTENVAANTRKNTVFVKGFDYEVTKDTLYQYFSKCGDVANIALPRCRRRGRSRRLAWITFTSAEAVEAALRCDGSVLNTDPRRALRISIAQPPRPKNASSGGKDKARPAKKAGRQQQHPTLTVGDIVLLDLKREGVVKYIGTVRFAPGEWIGIQLNNHSGKHNGVINGYRYFQCAENRGTFVRRNRIRKRLGHDPAVSRAAQAEAGYLQTPSSTLQTPFSARKKVHSRNVSILADNTEEFPELRGAMSVSELGSRFTRPRDHPFGRPPAGFAVVPRHSHPPVQKSNTSPSLSGPPPHPPHWRLTVRRPMPTGPPDSFNMSQLGAHLGRPAVSQRTPSRSPPGIQPRSLSGMVSLDDAVETSVGDLKTPRVGTPEARPKPIRRPGETSKLLVSG